VKFGSKKIPVKVKQEDSLETRETLTLQKAFYKLNYDKINQLVLPAKVM